jgi:hypothetical protein
VLAPHARPASPGTTLPISLPPKDTGTGWAMGDMCNIHTWPLAPV